MQTPPGDIDQIERTLWDVVVVGTGMGGATLGYALARAGRRVLFVEKGKSFLPPATDAIFDRWAETIDDAWRAPDDRKRKILERGGRSTDDVEDHSSGRPQHSMPLLGSGTGGSSSIYAAVLERFFPLDFAPREHFGDIGDSTLPEAWPLTYDDLEPWYEQAEQLYRVRGAIDPLRPHEDCANLTPPSNLIPGNAELFEHLQQKGLNPYRLHIATEEVDDCQNCIGFLCSRSCKNDAGRICLAPAISEHGAQLLTECRALRLEADRKRVKQVICDHDGRSIALKGRVVVLAAGSLITPVLLLQSRSVDWPDGLANRSGLVGRNLMKHCPDIVLIRTRDPAPTAGQTKQIAFNDLYVHDGDKLGTVQSLGPLPPFEYLIGQTDTAARIARWTAPVARPLWNQIRSRRMPISAILEDLPYHDNRVLPVDGGDQPGRQRLRLTYRRGEHDLRRVKIFREQISEAFRPYHLLWAKTGDDNRSISHCCGTCRFGNDPQASVLNADNRSHDVGNLYVADASFFPSSTGMNPALTIAANALRMAPIIDAQLEAGEE